MDMRRVVDQSMKWEYSSDLIAGDRCERLFKIDKEWKASVEEWSLKPHDQLYSGGLSKRLSIFIGEGAGKAKQ